MRPLLRVAGQQLLVLQVLLMENRIRKMLLIPGTVFCAHLQGVEDMDLGTGHMDLIRQRGDKIGIELIFAALHGHIGTSLAKHFQKSLDITPRLFGTLIQTLLEKFCLELSIPNHGVDQWQQNIRLQFCRQRRCLIQIGAAQNALVHVDVLPCRQQPHEGAAQRAAVGCPNATTAVGLEVGFDLLGFLQHGGKFGLFSLIKAIVADAQYPEAVSQKRDHGTEIAFPMATGAWQQQQRRGILCTKRVDLQRDTFLLFLFSACK